jgi:flagellum-specific peptidoglycan hydrolase FlgJ
MERTEFVKKYAEQVNKITSGTGISPQVLFAQAILESSGKDASGKWGVGNSLLARKYKNFFGIKASSKWKGPSVNLETQEYFTSTPVTIKDSFRVYNSFEDSAKDFIKFLQENPRYTKAGVFNAKTPEQQIQAIKNAGYATAPNYVQLVMGIIDKNVKQFVPEFSTIQKAAIGGGAIITALAIFFFLVKNK